MFLANLNITLNQTNNSNNNNKNNYESFFVPYTNIFF